MGMSIDCHLIQIHKAIQLPQNRSYTSCLFQIPHGMLPGGLDFYQIRSPCADLPHLLKRHMEPRLMGNGRNMQRHICRTAYTHPNGSGQLQHLLGYNVSWTNIFFHHLHNPQAAHFCHSLFLSRYRMGAAAPRHGKSQSLRYNRHGVGCSHHGAGTGARRHDPLHVLILFFAQLPARQLADHLFQLVGRIFLALIFSRHHRAAGDNNRRNIHPQSRHNHSWNNLIAAPYKHHSIQLMCPCITLDGIHNQLPAREYMAHAHMPLGEAIADRNCIYLKGYSTRLTHSIFHHLPQNILMHMARMHFIECVNHSDKRLGQLLICKPHTPKMRSGARHRQAIYYMTASIFGILIL